MLSNEIILAISILYFMSRAETEIQLNLGTRGMLVAQSDAGCSRYHLPAIWHAEIGLRFAVGSSQR